MPSMDLTLQVMRAKDGVQEGERLSDLYFTMDIINCVLSCIVKNLALPREIRPLPSASGR